MRFRTVLARMLLGPAYAQLLEKPLQLEEPDKGCEVMAASHAPIGCFGSGGVKRSTFTVISAQGGTIIEVRKDRGQHPDDVEVVVVPDGEDIAERIVAILVSDRFL